MINKAYRIATKSFRWMNNEKKTFIILTPGFPESEADSTCLPMQQQFVRTLKELHPGINIIVLSFQYPYHKNPYRWFDIMVMPFCGRNKGGLSKLLLRRRVNASLKKIHGTTKITGLFSFWYNGCAFVGKKFGDKYGVRHCWWILGQEAKRENKYPRLLYLPADELIALSDFLQNEFEKNHGVRPQFVIPPGIDPGQFDNSIKE